MNLGISKLLTLVLRHVRMAIRDDARMDARSQLQQKSRRYRRRKLGAPPVVDAIFAGPPELDLDDRGPLLAAVRAAIEAGGLQLSEIRGGWGYRVLASDDDARSRLQADERQADDHDHWWLDDAVWRSSDGQSVVVYCSDPDGIDVSFHGWGPRARTSLEAVKERLDAHRPSGESPIEK